MDWNLIKDPNYRIIAVSHSHACYQSHAVPSTWRDNERANTGPASASAFVSWSLACDDIVDTESFSASLTCSMSPTSVGMPIAGVNWLCAAKA